MTERTDQHEAEAYDKINLALSDLADAGLTEQSWYLQGIVDALTFASFSFDEDDVYFEQYKAGWDSAKGHMDEGIV